MPIASGFSQDPNPNPNYYIRKPGKTELLDESIYYKQDQPFQRPVEVSNSNRPIIKETVFLPDRKVPSKTTNRDPYLGQTQPVSSVYPPTKTNRDAYLVQPQPVPTVYSSTATNPPPSSSFNLIRALGLNADCPCWAWIVIIFGIALLISLVAMCLYFILDREKHI